MVIHGAKNDIDEVSDLEDFISDLNDLSTARHIVRRIQQHFFEDDQMGVELSNIGEFILWHLKGDKLSIGCEEHELSHWNSAAERIVHSNFTLCCPSDRKELTKRLRKFLKRFQ